MNRAFRKLKIINERLFRENLELKKNEDNTFWAGVFTGVIGTIMPISIMGNIKRNSIIYEQEERLRELEKRN